MGLEKLRSGRWWAESGGGGSMVAWLSSEGNVGLGQLFGIWGSAELWGRGDEGVSGLEGNIRFLGIG